MLCCHEFFCFQRVQCKVWSFQHVLASFVPENPPKRCPTRSLRCWILLLGREDFHYFSGKLKVENMIKIIP